MFPLPKTPQRRFRILLIDDNKHGLVGRRSFLEEKGYQVDTAGSGREGLAKFDEQPFDLVVTDYRMPKINGLKVVEGIRERNDRVPVVILSGYATKLGLTKASTGADAVLSKGPRECQDLEETIAKLLRKPARRQRARRAARGSRAS